jgi:putative alpha-1,2-mannosidase
VGFSFYYIVFSLFFNKVTVHLPSHTKPLTITAKGATFAKYVHGLTIDGQTFGSPVIRHEQTAAQVCGLR